MELENFDQVVNVDAVDVAIGEGSQVNYRLSQPSFFPARVSTDIIFAQEGEYFSILDDLQGAGNNEDEVSDALTLPDDEVPGGAVSHPEVCGQRPETAIAGKSEGGMSIENSPGKTYLLVSIYVSYSHFFLVAKATQAFAHYNSVSLSVTHFVSHPISQSK